jgi:hypothetical protein
MKYTIDGATLIVTGVTTLLRCNKQAGLFATGNIDMSDPDSMAQYGRGKTLEIVPCQITDNLHGDVGKITKTDFIHVSGIVVSSESPKLPAGLLVEFVVNGFEIERIREYAQEAEIAADLGLEMKPQIMRLKFDKSIKVANGTIRPPTISFRDPTDGELPLANAAAQLYDLYPATIVDPVVGFPGLNQGCGTAPVLRSGSPKSIGAGASKGIGSGDPVSGPLGLVLEGTTKP